MLLQNKMEMVGNKQNLNALTKSWDFYHCDDESLYYH